MEALFYCLQVFMPHLSQYFVTKIEQVFIGTPEPSQPEKDLPNNVYFCSEVCNRSTQIHQDVNNGA
ncbi:MAG: hypothetical protein NXI25_06675 [bacterium]|nr:hypothetical protein [bacterium]